MFDNLYVRSAALARHREGPMAKEREEFYVTRHLKECPATTC